MEMNSSLERKTNGINLVVVLIFDLTVFVQYLDVIKKRR